MPTLPIRAILFVTSLVFLRYGLKGWHPSLHHDSDDAKDAIKDVQNDRGDDDDQNDYPVVGCSPQFVPLGISHHASNDEDKINQSLNPTSATSYQLDDAQADVTEIKSVNPKNSQEPCQ
jgi:hypothetical protein